MSEHTSKKKEALAAKKEALMNEIRYYEIKVVEARSVFTNNNNVLDDSSDSEQEVMVDVGPSITELKLRQRLLKTCLQATQELTSVIVLQSEINVLVQDPVLNREAPVTEEGVWREVTAECRIDLVPFSINFYVHKPTRLFAPTSFRSLQVTPVKSSHEVELSRSVLTNVTKPSDAIEMLRNYSAAHRSRRTTLARLAEKYSDTLFMEPMPEGGYILKCAGLMEVQWTLQNKWSPLAPFHHRMVFDLEFMDESYIKLISQLHRQIIDPTLETDERTLLLAKIINTCLEARSTIQNQNESTESESEAAEKLRSRRTTLDQEPEAPERSKKKDSEVMAPPKSLPKKSKPKGKENTEVNKAKPVKRAADIGETENAKKSKTIESKNSESKTNSKKSVTSKVKEDDALQTDVKLNKVQQNGIGTSADEKIEKEAIVDKNIHKKKEDKTKNKQKTKDELSKGNEKNNGKEAEKSNVVKKINTKENVGKTNDEVDLNKNKETVVRDKDIIKNTQNKNIAKVEDNNRKNSVTKNKVESNKQTKSNDKQPKTVDKKDHKEKETKENVKVQKSKDNKKGLKEIKNKPDKLKETNEKKVKEKTTDSSHSKNAKTIKESNKDKEGKLISKLPNLVKNHKEPTKKPNTVNYLKNQFLPKKSQAPNKALATKIPRISPRKLSNLKPAVQDISKSSRSSTKSLQKGTNIPRLLKKPQPFKPKV